MLVLLLFIRINKKTKFNRLLWIVQNRVEQPLLLFFCENNMLAQKIFRVRFYNNSQCLFFPSDFKTSKILLLNNVFQMIHWLDKIGIWTHSIDFEVQLAVPTRNTDMHPTKMSVWHFLLVNKMINSQEGLKTSYFYIFVIRATLIHSPCRPV